MKKLYVRKQTEKTVDNEELTVIEIFRSNPNDSHSFILFNEK